MTKLIEVLGWVEEFGFLFEEQIRTKKEIETKEKEINKIENKIENEIKKLPPSGLSPERKKEIVFHKYDDLRKLSEEKIPQLKHEIVELNYHTHKAKRCRREKIIKLSVFFEKHNSFYSENRWDGTLVNEVNSTLKNYKPGVEKRNFLTPYLVWQLRLYRENFEQQIRKEKENSQNLLDKAHQDIEELRKELKEEEELVDIKDRRIDELTDKVNDLEKQIEKDKKIIKNLRKQTQRLDQNIGELEQDIYERDNEYKKLEKWKDKLKDKYNKQIDNLHKLEQSKDASLVRLRNKAKLEIGKLRDEVNRLKHKLDTRTDQRDRAKKKLEDLKNKQQTLRTEAKNKKVNPNLVRSKSINNQFLDENDDSLVRSIEKTSNLLVNVIAKTQNYLGVDDLTKIKDTHKMPEDKSLKDLIEFYNNPPVSSPDNHQETRNQRDNYKPQAETTNEQARVVQELNEVLNLSLKKPTLKQVISKIQELIIKDPLVETIETPFGEDLEVIKNIDLNSLEKELGIYLDGEVKQKIIQATSYKELVAIREQEVKNFLNQQVGQELDNRSTQPVPVDKRWWLLIVLLIIKILIIGGLTVKILCKDTVKGSRWTKTKKIK